MHFALLYAVAIRFSIGFLQVVGCELCPRNLWTHGTWGPVPPRDTIQVGFGETCNMVYTRAIVNRSACEQAIKKYRDPCCNGNTTFTPQCKPMTLSGTRYATGTNSICKVCSNNAVPKNRYVIIRQSYLPMSFSCIQLYDYGWARNVPDAFCYHLQVSVARVCGC